MPPSIPDTTYVHSLLSFPSTTNPPVIDSTIKTLNLQPHPEGGFFVQTDLSPHLIPNPFLSTPTYPNASSTERAHSKTRNASTTIFYLLAPTSPLGHFHRNKARTVHTLHSGKGRYVILHPDETDERTGRKPRVETFVVGHDLGRGERLQWIVEGGRWKCSFLLPDKVSLDGTEGGVVVEEEQGKGGKGGTEGGLLISETVVPGFEFCDHDFLTAEGLREMFGEEEVKEMGWMLLEEEQGKL